MKNFVVYKSSAGSGKTFTLVKEYLRLALHDEKKLNSGFKRILAVTFTNKAAAEMKNRVIEALHDISQNKKNNVLQSILETELKIDSDELKRRSEIVLSQILHHYSDLSIGTIDSFTHKIVKTFAHDLDLPVNFNIELDTAGFYEKVVSALFSQIGEDEYVSHLLKDYVLNKAQDNASWDPEAQILEFSKLLQKENSSEYIEILRQFNGEELESFRKQFLDYIKHYRDTLKQTSAKAVHLISTNGLEASDFWYGANGPQNFFNKCFNLQVELKDAESTRLNEAIEKNKWAAEKNPHSVVKVGAISQHLTDIATELKAFITENYSYYSLCELLSRQMYPLMLLKKIEEISQAQKDEERLVFISEFNQKIFDIINNEPTPFIYERLGDRYQHYLLDEFQDTSGLQWQNLLPLLDNSLSNGWFNLVVGDGKQSIYRWRNANVKQFAELPQVENSSNNVLIAERAATLKRNFENRVLDANYRSLSTIVEFNNAFFAPQNLKLLVEPQVTIYESHFQKAAAEKGGYVSIHTGKIERDVLDATTLQIIRTHIDHAVKSGFSLNDICILSRKNAHGNLVADDLIAHGIQVISSDSLLLGGNLEVQTLIAYLRYLNNQDDKISSAVVVNYLCQTNQINSEDRPKLLRELATGTRLSSVLSKHKISLYEDQLALNNLFDICVQIVRALQLEQHAYHYIRFFLDEVNEFLVLHNSNISDFLDAWESKSSKASMVIPDNTDAVKIMTIHASKGLEFPVVIIPYCNWGIYKANEHWVKVNNDKVKLPVSVIGLSRKVTASGFEKEFEAEQQEQLLDNLNMLYVAFTRAVERLHVISLVGSKSTQASVAQWIDKHVQQMQTGSEQGLYMQGTPGPKQSKAKKKNTLQFNLEPLQFTSVSDQVKIKTSHKLGSDDAEHAKKQGILMHWLLSKIKTASEIQDAVESGVLSGDIHSEEKNALIQQLKALCEKPEISEFFKQGLQLKTEAELVSPNGEILRPDRIVFEKNQTIIIDYKTGKENNKVYAKQLQRYSEALGNMGYLGIKKYILYLDEPILIELK